MNRHARRAAAAIARDQSAVRTTDDGGAVVTHDGFQNILAGLGLGQDAVLSAGRYARNDLTKDRVQLENMYRVSWMVRAIVDAVPEDMTREGITISSEDPPQRQEEIQAALSSMGLWDGLLDVLKYSRLYGGALAYLDLEGQDPCSPLRLDSIAPGQFKGLAVFDRWQLFPDMSQLVLSGPDRGMPMYYTLVADITTGRLTQLRMHYSRVLRFIGCQLPRWQAITENLWGATVLEPLLDRLIAFDQATTGAANLLRYAHLRTFLIDGAREIMGMGGKAEENLMKMLKHVARLQAGAGVTMLDGKDKMESHTYSFTGVADIILQFAQQVGGAEKIPLVRLFGQSPVGLNATGDSDWRNYYDGISARQEATLRRPVGKLLQVLYRSMYGAPPPASFDFDFASLWQMTNLEKAQVAASSVTTLSTAFGDGAIHQGIYLRELRQLSETTGLFTNVTKEDIAAADMANEPPPVAADLPGMPGAAVDPASPLGRLAAAAGTAAPAASAAGDPMSRLVAAASGAKVPGGRTPPPNAGGGGLAELQRMAASA